jgi:hypothetical protein
VTLWTEEMALLTSRSLNTLTCSYACQHDDPGHQNDDQSFTLWHSGSFCVVGHSVYNEFVFKAGWAVIFRSDREIWGR